MCGIAGVWDARATMPVEDVVRKDISCIVHRGPDDSGTWVSADEGLGLGQRRLAIQDLSSAGHQPMISRSGRFVLVLNGEIYNHLELREELQAARGAISWRGHSDTETLLALFEAHGIRKALEMCVGMFAIALWDRESRTLTLARDRVVGKPGLSPSERCAADSSFWIGAQDHPDCCGRFTAGGSCGAYLVHASQLCACAALHLPGCIQGRAWMFRRVFIADCTPESYDLLERARGGDAWPGESVLRVRSGGARTG